MLPTLEHLAPALGVAAYEFGIMDIEKAIRVAVASKRFISSPYSTLLPLPRLLQLLVTDDLKVHLRLVTTYSSKKARDFAIAKSPDFLRLKY